jgi:hypothetical protein
MSVGNAPARSIVSPSLAMGERGPPAPSTNVTPPSAIGWVSAARSAIVNGGSPSISAAIGGATATRYQRCGGHTSNGASPLAAASTSASVGSPPGSNDCTGFFARTFDVVAARNAPMVAAVNHVLPTSVRVPVTTTST